jgi:hypothetical protein
MGFLNFFVKRRLEMPLRLPSGSFTVNKGGAITASTLPRAFPIEVAREIAAAVTATFKDARATRLPLMEFNVNYPGLKIAAREVGEGAIIFVMPRALGQR